MKLDHFAAKRWVSLLLLLSNVIEILSLIVVATGMFSENIYLLREVIAMIANIGFLIIPIEFVIWSVSTVRCKKEKSAPKSARATVLSLLVVISCLFTVFSVFLFSQGRSSFAYYPDGLEKLSEHDAYYIMVMDRKLQITKAQYDKIENGESYAIEYRWNDCLQCSKVISIEDDNGNRF